MRDTRGRKQETAENGLLKRVIQRDNFEPTSPLSDEERAEFDRVVGCLRALGSIGLVDLSVVTMAARQKVRVDRAIAAGLADDEVLKLEKGHLSTLRSIGLTTMPKRQHIRSDVDLASKFDEPPDPIEGMIRLAE